MRVSTPVAAIAVHLAYLDPYPVPALTPSAMQILQMADALAAAGAELSLVTPAPPVDVIAVLGRTTHPRLRLIPLLDIRKRWFFPFSTHRIFFLQALAWIRRHRPQAIFVRNLKFAAWLLPKVKGIPVYFETHELFAQTFREEHPGNMTHTQQRKFDLLEQREAAVYRGASGLFALTEALAKDIRQRYKVTTLITVLPDGVDTEALAPALAASVPVEAGRPPRILYLGSLHPWKGVDVLVRAMVELADEELWIAGGETARIEHLKDLAAKLGCGDRVRFLGKIPPPDRFRLIGQCDICALPLSITSIGSRYTSPLKLFEYMGMGKPIIASDLPSLREVIRHAENGWLVEAENSAALAAGIAELLADPVRAAAMGTQAAADAADYSWFNRAKRVLQTMEKQA
jgi:glycosyltransferase involved in cell wall biosynthesis